MYESWFGVEAVNAFNGEMHRLAYQCVRAIHVPVPRLYASVNHAVQVSLVEVYGS